MKALIFHPDVARQFGQAAAVLGVLESVGPVVQSRDAREISIERRRQAAERVTVVGAREDSRALLEAADSNSVLGEP